MAQTFLDKTGLSSFWSKVKTAISLLVGEVNRLKEFGYNYDDFAETDLLWKPSNDAYLGQESFYSVASTCEGSDVRLHLPDTLGGTFDDSNYSDFTDDDYEFFERRFQYYSFFNATNHDITLTLLSDEFPIIIKDNVTSFTIPSGGLIEFCGKYVDIAPSMDGYFGNDYAYMITYTQYF